MEFDEDTPGKLSSKRRMLDPPSDIPADEPLLVSSPPDSSLPSSSPPDLPSPDIHPSRSVRHTEKGTEWQAQLLQTREHAKIRRQTPAARSAADATVLMVAHAIIRKNSAPLEQLASSS